MGSASSSPCRPMCKGNGAPPPPSRRKRGARTKPRIFLPINPTLTEIPHSVSHPIIPQPNPEMESPHRPPDETTTTTTMDRNNGTQEEEEEEEEEAVGWRLECIAGEARSIPATSL